MECHWWVLIPLLKCFESKVNYPYIYIYIYIFGCAIPPRMLARDNQEALLFLVLEDYRTKPTHLPLEPQKHHRNRTMDQIMKSWTQTKRFDQKSMDQLILILGQQEKAEGIFWGTHCHWVSWAVWYVPSHSPYFQVQDFYRLITLR